MDREVVPAGVEFAATGRSGAPDKRRHAGLHDVDRRTIQDPLGVRGPSPGAIERDHRRAIRGEAGGCSALPWRELPRGRLGGGSIGSLFLVGHASAYVHGHAHSDQLDASDRDVETALGVLQEVILESALAARLTHRYQAGARRCRRAAALLFRLAPRLAVVVVERVSRDR